MRRWIMDRFLQQEYFKVQYVVNPKKSLFVYNSRYVKDVKKNKLLYMAKFKYELEKLIDEGYNTIYFAISYDDNITLSFIEQANYLACEKGSNIKVVVYSAIYPLPTEYFSNVQIRRLDIRSYHMKKKLFEKINRYTSVVLGIVRDNDRLMKPFVSSPDCIHSLINKEIVLPENLKLTCMLSAVVKRKFLRGYGKEEIENIIFKYGYENLQSSISYGFEAKDIEERKFWLNIIYTFELSNQLNNDFEHWSNCFIELMYSIRGNWRFYIGFNRLVFDGCSEWKIGLPSSIHNFE